MEKQNIPDEEIRFDILRQYIPYWPLFVLLTIISLSGAWLYLRYKKPVYQVNAKILVKDEKKGLDDSQVLDALNIFAEKKIVENETDIIRSWPLLEEVVKDLKLYTSQWSRGKIRDNERYGTDAPLVFTSMKPDSISSVEKIPFSIDFNNRTVNIQNQKIPFGGIVKIEGHEYKMELNPLYRISDEKEFLVQFHNVFAMAMNIQNGLKITPTSKQSSMINVSYETTVPAKGKDIVNHLFTVYNKASLHDKNQVAQNTLTFVDERLGLVTRQLDSVEKNIESYKTNKGIVDISAQGQIFLETVKEADTRLTEVSIQLGVLKDIENYVQGKGPNPGTVPSMIGINDPTLGQLLEKLYSVELEYQRLSKITGEQNDQLIVLRDQINQLRPNILENIASIRRNLSVSQNRMSGDVSQTTAMLRTIPQKEKALLEISRQQAIKNNIYTFLLQKREEAALSYASAVADSRIIESAKPGSKPIKPVPMLIFGIALVIGLGAALLYVAIKEQFNNKLLFGKELEAQTGIPIIGEVAYSNLHEDFVIGEGKRTVVAEQIRAIRGNLSYFGINDRDKKVLLVTSSIPGEGKSFISTNLAVSLTLTGKKVALLELDLRKPKVSKIFQMERDKGISNYLVGGVHFEEIINSTPFKNLFVITSGPIPPNPTELLLLPAFGELINELKLHFDFILIDTPPAGLVSDAQILAEHADASIFVARHDHTPKSYLQLLGSLYEGKKFRNMSVVFNGVKPRGMKIYGSGYGYGYGYGNGNSYGYGKGYYQEDKPKHSVKRSIRQRISSFLS
jgi:capsular exopolysaccharide synthesis family protein